VKILETRFWEKLVEGSFWKNLENKLKRRGPISGGASGGDGIKSFTPGLVTLL
jgi:hypothetical protein